MARFRYHRGSLAESLSTEIQVNNLQDIANNMGLPDAILRCEFYSEDLRSDGYKETYIVTEKRGGVTAVIGFSDSMLK